MIAKTMVSGNCFVIISARMVLRWPDSRESIRRFARIAWFSRIVSGFSNWTPFLRIALQGAKNCESQVWGDSRESLARYENRYFLRIDSRESICANRPDSRCESPGHLRDGSRYAWCPLHPHVLCLMQLDHLNARRVGTWRWRTSWDPSCPAISPWGSSAVDSLGTRRGPIRRPLKTWDPSFPFQNTKFPRSENPGKLLKNYSLDHPGPVLKIAEEKQKLLKVVAHFCNFSGIFRAGPGWAK